MKRIVILSAALATLIFGAHGSAVFATPNSAVICTTTNYRATVALADDRLFHVTLELLNGGSVEGKDDIQVLEYQHASYRSDLQVESAKGKTKNLNLDIDYRSFGSASSPGYLSFSVGPVGEAAATRLPMDCLVKG